MDLTVAKKFTDRVVSVELEFLAARETRMEAISDLKLEMRKQKQLTPAEVKAVIRAAKIELEPLEKRTAREEEEELAKAIVDTKRSNGDQRPLGQ
jgi:hypothetical protein